MQRVMAIAVLTWRAAFRFRLFLVVAVLLLGSVVALPLILQDDGTARGFTQILLTYTLATITGLLGLSTLWLACGTLARDIEECQIQVVATKPIARWQIWIGKWLGIMSLNAALLALAGSSVFVLMQYRAGRLPADQQKILRNEVFVARGSARPPDPTTEINERADQLLKERLQKDPVTQADLAEVRNQIREQIKAEYTLVPPGYSRQWQIDLGSARHFLRDRPVYLRVKFNAAEKSPSGTFDGVWRAGVPQQTKLWQSDLLSLAPDTFHEFQLEPGLFDENGLLTLQFLNPNQTALLFPIEDGLEVLYREGGFGMNYVRGLAIILCWMALLAAVGLASASFLSFPVAAFFAMGLLAVVFSTGSITNGVAEGAIASAVSQGTIADYDAEHGTKGHSPADFIVIPVFKAILKVVSLVRSFSPVDSLSTGRTITWEELGKAVAQIVVLMSGFFALFGIFVFSRRELATAQGTT